MPLFWPRKALFFMIDVVMQSYGGSVLLLCSAGGRRPWRPLLMPQASNKCLIKRKAMEREKSFELHGRLGREAGQQDRCREHLGRGVLRHAASVAEELRQHFNDMVGMKQTGRPNSPKKIGASSIAVGDGEAGATVSDHAWYSVQ